MILLTGCFLRVLCHPPQAAFGQGFVNLDFESANISGYSPGSMNVPTSDALPGWSAYFIYSSNFTSQATAVWYDGISIGGSGISIIDATIGFGLTPIEGQYSVRFQGEYNPANVPGFDIAARIAQTGLIPTTARSLVFWGDVGRVDVAFNGQLVPYFAIGSGANYTIYGADISAFAGQTGILGFTALMNGGGTLDNIFFSPQSIPEPITVGLFSLGSLLLRWRFWKRRTD